MRACSSAEYNLRRNFQGHAASTGASRSAEGNAPATGTRSVRRVQVLVSSMAGMELVQHQTCPDRQSCSASTKANKENFSMDTTAKL